LLKLKNSGLRNRGFALNPFKGSYDVLFAHSKDVWTQPWTLRRTHQNPI